MYDFGALIYGLLGRALYLDTNVWSELAKGNLPPQSIDPLLVDRANYLILGPYQVLELSRRPDLAAGLDALFDRFPVCFAGHSDDFELEGRPARAVGHHFFHTLSPFHPDLDVLVGKERGGALPCWCPERAVGGVECPERAVRDTANVTNVPFAT